MKKQASFNVLLADDHILLRDALANLINNFTEFNIIGAANNGKQLIDLVKRGPVPQLIILDLNMPEMDGYETALWLHENYPDIKLLILTLYDSEIALIRLLQLGVKGFLKKDVSPSELKTAMLSIINDGYYYAHDTTGKLAALFRKNGKEQTSVDRAMLSSIEIEFLKLASSELTYKEIADVMKLNPRAIDNYRDSLFDKLEVKSRVGLAIYAVKNGIVNL
ncbi:MAG: response regulator [Ferruginibacter sp.]